MVEDQIDDRNQEDPWELGPETNEDGSVNEARAKALDRYARFCYEYDRD